MLHLTKPITVGCIASLMYGLVATPAMAAFSLSDIDWSSYLRGYSFINGHAWLLVGSIALLVIGLMLKATRPEDSADPNIPLTGDRYTRRIGTMPIHPPESPVSP